VSAKDVIGEIRWNSVEVPLLLYPEPNLKKTRAGKCHTLKRPEKL